MADSALITVEDLNFHLAEYKSVAESARTDITPDSDLSAARLAPIVFLVSLNGFEATFDLVVHHYEEAMKKSDSDKRRMSISRECEEVFHLHIYILQIKIEDLKNKARESAWEKVKKPIAKVISNIKSVIFQDLVGTEELVDGAIDILTIFCEKVLLDWKMKEDEYFFFMQIGNVYQKILDSHCYSGDFSLLQNTFSTNKEKVLPIIVQKRGLSASVDLLGFAKTKSEKRDAVRIIIDELINLNRYEDILLLVPLVTSKVDNVWELKPRIMRGYKSSVLGKVTSTTSKVKTALKAAALLYIFFSFISVFVMAGVIIFILQAFGFESAAGNYLVILGVTSLSLPIVFLAIRRIGRNNRIRQYQ